MRKKLVWIICMLMSMSVSAFAQTPYMGVWSSGSPSFWAVDGIDSVTFFEKLPDPPPPYTPCSFNIYVGNISEFKAIVDVNPSKSNIFYRFDVMTEEKYLTYDTDSAIASDYSSNPLDRGARGSYFSNLEPGTNYYAFAFCVDTATNLLMGDITKTKFTTKPFPFVSLSFSIQFTDTAVWFYPNDSSIHYIWMIMDADTIRQRGINGDTYFDEFIQKYPLPDEYATPGPSYLLYYPDFGPGPNWMFWAKAYRLEHFYSDLFEYEFTIPDSLGGAPSYRESRSRRTVHKQIREESQSTGTVKTHLVLQPLSGQDCYYAISQIGHIAFQNGDLFLYDKSGTELGHTPLDEIGKIIFAEKGDNLSEHHASCLVYPNPTNSELIIHGVEGGRTIRIYSLQGILINTVPTQTDETVINVSSLPDGTYLLQIGAEIVKFIKQ